MANNNGNSIMALLFGAALGVGLGFLIAPDKGSKTRSRLKREFDDLKDEAKFKWSLFEEETKQKVSDKIDHFKNAAL